MFITFEGIDCCGKSTQAKLLADRLGGSGREVVLLREPGNTRISETIREILLNEQFNEMEERTELLLFAASRAQLVAEVILPALEQDKIVISDRFYDSTVAYQGYGRQLPLEDIYHVNRIATQELVPDMTFYIDISPETALERCRDRIDAATDRMETSGLRFYERVMNGYMRIARENGSRFYIVNGQKPIEEVQATIWRLIQERNAELPFPRVGAAVNNGATLASATGMKRAV
jgi:dTMP kinase